MLMMSKNPFVFVPSFFKSAVQVTYFGKFNLLTSAYILVKSELATVVLHEFIDSSKESMCQGR